MPLSYHRSTPSQYGDWPFSHTDDANSSPQIPVTSITEVIAKRFSGSYDYKPSTASFTPSITRFTPSQVNKRLPPTPPPTWNAAPARLMPPNSLPSSPIFEHALPSSPITPNFSLERCSSLLDPAVLDRLSPLDALQQELFEAESLCCSSPDMPTFQVQDYDSIVEPSIRSPSPNLRPLRLPSMRRREEYTVVGLRSSSVNGDQVSESESKKRRSIRFGNVFRLRGKSDRCEEVDSPKVQQKSALTCPAYSFLDMSDDEEEQETAEDPVANKVLAGLNRLNPINAVRQRASSSQTIKRAREAKAERNYELRRTSSRPAGLSLTRSATTLFSSLPSSIAAAVKSPKLSTSPTLSFTSNKSRKAKLSVAAIRRTEGPPLTLTSTAPANALGLHDAYGEAVKLGDHLNENFPFPSPPPPAPYLDDRSDPLDAFESPKLTRGSHCSRHRRRHRHTNLKGLNDAPLIHGSPSSFTSNKSEEEADRTATPTMLQRHQATDPDWTPAASRYAKYSPPACTQTLPRSATTGAVTLKRSIRSSSDGEMPISLKKSAKTSCPTTTSPPIKRSVSSQTVAARRHGSRGCQAPPPFPPPSCPLPPLPASFKKK